MHEVSIALAIVDELTERSSLLEGERVTTVLLRVGAMTAVVPEALEFAWELAAQGTAVDGSTLEIERVPLAIACDPCAREIEIESGAIPVCPRCGTPSSRIVRGRELQIVAMEVTDADDAPGGYRTERSAEERALRV